MENFDSEELEKIVENSVRELVPADDPILREVAKEVTIADNESMGNLAMDIMISCHVLKGAGLAAPQIGESVRIFTINTTMFNPITTGLGSGIFINPEMFPTPNNGKNVYVEGCLSLPDILVPIKRRKEVRLVYYNEVGEKKARTFKGPVARAIQHEMDHLNGKLITDYA